MATRFYLPDGVAADVSVAKDSAWTGTASATNLLRQFKGTTAIAAGSTVTVAVAAIRSYIDRQYVSPPLKGGQSISGTVKFQALVREFASNDNIDRLMIGLRVVSLDGATIRATLLAVADYASTAEFLDTGFRNKKGADGDSLSSYTTVDGD